MLYPARGDLGRTCGQIVSELESRFENILNCKNMADQISKDFQQNVVVKAFSAGYQTHVRSPPDYQVYFDVNGRKHTEHSRGWNLLVIDPISGNLLTSKKFDTYANSNSLAQLTVSLNEASDGAIVALAVKDTGDFAANSQMGQDFIRAMKSCGGVGKEVKYRAAYAMVGRKGSILGSATEMYNADGYPVTATSTFACPTPAPPPLLLPGTAHHFQQPNMEWNSSAMTNADTGVTAALAACETKISAQQEQIDRMQCAMDTMNMTINALTDRLGAMEQQLDSHFDPVSSEFP